jgi:hypothetical protein
MWDGYGDKLAGVTFAIANWCWQLDSIKSWRLTIAEAQKLHDTGHVFLRRYKDLSLTALANRQRKYGLLRALDPSQFQSFTVTPFDPEAGPIYSGLATLTILTSSWQTLSPF